MAIINVDDAYILNETGAQVDKVTGLFTKNENATTGEKQMARLNIAAGGSNRNLLDNWYFVGGGSQLGDGIFPINQRGQTSYAGGAGIDRWSSDSQIALTASGITISANAIYQNQSKEFFDGLLGKTVTYSILTTGGAVKSATIQFPSSYPQSVTVQEIYNDGESSIGYALFPAGNGQAIRIIGVPVAAAKLELGTVSTLANDAPPDFGEELRKCQRYLRDVSLKRTPCYFDGTYPVAVLTLTGIEMAKSPTPSLITAGFAWQPAASASANLTAVSLITFEQYTPTIQFPLSAALSGMGMIYDTVIRLSCEL